MTYDELLQFTELQRRVVALEQKANNDNNMVLKKAPNFANRLVEAFERIEALEVREHTDISDLGARLTGMEKAYEPPNSTDADDATATGAHTVDGDVVGVDALMAEIMQEVDDNGINNTSQGVIDDIIRPIIEKLVRENLRIKLQSNDNCKHQKERAERAEAERDAMQGCVDACRQILNTHIFARTSSCELAREAIAKLDAQKEGS